MSPQATLALSPDQQRLVRAILHDGLGPGITAWVFGSRATGRVGRFSDLDLAIDAGRALSADETARLAEACTESDLPFRVDLLDWHAVDARFREIVAADRINLAALAPADR